MNFNWIDAILHVDRSVAWVFQEWGWVAWALVLVPALPAAWGFLQGWLKKKR